MLCMVKGLETKRNETKTALLLLLAGGSGGGGGVCPSGPSST